MNERIDMKRSTDLAPYTVSRQRGFTLIEVLIATLVLSIGLLGLAGLQAVSLKMNQGSYLRVQAANLGYEIADAMRANRNNAAGYVGDFSTVTCNPSLAYAWTGAIAAADLAVWRNRLACLLPSGSGIIAVPASSTLATITVTWDETRLEGDETRLEGSASSQSLVFTTQL